MNLLYGLWATFGIVLGIVGAVALIFSSLIVIVSKACATEKNEEIEKITSLLSGANCGGCGFNGCADYAKALKEGRATLKQCNSTPEDNKMEIAKILNIPYSKGKNMMAVVHCAGGNVAINKYDYVGNESCVSQNSFMGGDKQCPNGCLGFGSCQSVCEHNAITITNGVAKINFPKCFTCGACVLKCPKKLISLIPKSSKVYVACSTVCKGKESMNNCKNSCIACGLCAKSCPQGAISMVNNIAVIDYDKCSGCKTCVSKCPRKCIKEIE